MAEEFNSAPSCTEPPPPDCVFAALAIPAGDGASYILSCLCFFHIILLLVRDQHTRTKRGRETPSLISTLYLGIKPRQSFREGYSVTFFGEREVGGGRSFVVLKVTEALMLDQG